MASLSSWISVTAPPWAAVYLAFLANHPLLAGLVAVLLLILFGDLLRGFGVPLLSWNEKKWAQLLAGFSVAILLSYIFLAGYLIDLPTIDQAWAVYPLSAPGRPALFVFGGLVLSGVASGLVALLRRLTNGAPHPPGGADDADDPGGAVGSPANNEEEDESWARRRARPARRNSWQPRMTVRGTPSPPAWPLALGSLAGFGVSWTVIYFAAVPVAGLQPPWTAALPAAFEFARLFPDHFDAMPLSTAARMSASFPYVSPAATLPTNPRRRVVDAGYYDNYGVNVACAWLNEFLGGASKVPADVSRILVVQIRDGAVEVPPPPTPQRSPFRFFRVSTASSARSPPILSARNSVPYFRNDEQFELLRSRLNAEPKQEDIFQVATFTYDGDASLSWYLTEDEKRSLYCQAFDAVQEKEKLKTLAAIQKSVGAHPATPRSPESVHSHGASLSAMPPSCE